MKRKKGNQTTKRHEPTAGNSAQSPPPEPHEPQPWAAEQAEEHSRQQAMAARARDKATRNQVSVGQSGTVRVKRLGANQPRGGR